MAAAGLCWQARGTHWTGRKKSTELVPYQSRRPLSPLPTPPHSYSSLRSRSPGQCRHRLTLWLSWAKQSETETETETNGVPPTVLLATGRSATAAESIIYYPTVVFHVLFFFFFFGSSHSLRFISGPPPSHILHSNGYYLRCVLISAVLVTDTFILKL